MPIKHVQLFLDADLEKNGPTKAPLSGVGADIARLIRGGGR